MFLFMIILQFVRQLPECRIFDTVPREHNPEQLNRLERSQGAPNWTVCAKALAI